MGPGRQAGTYGDHARLGATDADSARYAHPRWRAVFERLEQRRGSGTAIVAVARKLLVVVWHVLQAREADRYADAAQVARKFFSWSERVGKAARGGEPAGTHVRRELTRLGLGAELTRIVRGGQVCRLPPAAPAG
jgi:hypothetical protein